MSMAQLVGAFFCAVSLVLPNLALADDSIAPKDAPRKEGDVGLLCAELKGPDWKSRINAAKQLGRSGLAAKAAINDLIAAWEDVIEGKSDWQSRQDFIHAIEATLEEAGPSAVPSILQSYDRKGHSLLARERLLELLTRLGRRYRGDALKPAVPMMIMGLEDDESRIVSKSLLALAEAGTSGRIAIPRLLLILQKEQLNTAEAGHETLRKLQTARALQRITENKSDQAFDFLRRYHINMFLIEAATQDKDAGNLIALSLVSDGADVNAVYVPESPCHSGHWGYTALMHASFNGNELLVRALLKAGADPNIQRKGNTSLDYAERNRHASVVQLLKEAGGTPGDIPAPQPVE